MYIAEFIARFIQIARDLFWQCYWFVFLNERFTKCRPHRIMRHPPMKIDIRILSVSVAAGHWVHQYLSHCYGNEGNQIPSRSKFNSLNRIWLLTIHHPNAWFVIKNYHYDWHGFYSLKPPGVYFIFNSNIATSTSIIKSLDKNQNLDRIRQWYC